jgi:uncharacterized protein (TIGR02391 family)
MNSTGSRINKRKAIELLRQLIDEIPHLRTLKYDNPELKPWVDRVKNILSLAFDDDDYQKFVHAKLRLNMLIMGDEIHRSDYDHNLTTRKTVLQSIIDKHELLETKTQPTSKREPEDTDELLLYLFDSMQFHPKIVKASKKLFKDGHYSDAIFRAFTEVNNSVKAKTRSELDGKALMAQAFRIENPLIKLNELETQSERDEQEGFMFLFMGAMVGIRNPKAHDNIIQIDPLRTLEYLALASLLMKRVEEGHSELGN